MASRASLIPALLLSVFVLAACDGDAEEGPPAASSAAIPDTFWTDADLPDAVPAGEVRRDAKDGDEVVVTGRVKEFVDGRAVFTLIDKKLKSCREMEGDACPTPWDYCCVEPNVIADNTLTVEIQGDDGRPLHAGIAGWNGLDHLQEVTVRGKAKRDAQGNVTVAVAALRRD